MNLANASRGLDSVVHEEPVEWWEIVVAFTPLAALLGIAAVIVWCVVRRPASGCVAGAETRAEWWSRAEWAMEMALDDTPERRNVGIAVLKKLSTVHFVGKEDAQILAQAMVLLDRR